MIVAIVLSIIFFLFLGYLVWDNYRITTRKISIKIGEEETTNNKLEKKESKRQVKILHLSDFHNRSWRDNNKYLLDNIKKTNPEYVFISGDLIDHRKTNTKVVEELIDDLNKILYSETENIQNTENIKNKESIDNVDNTENTENINHTNKLEPRILYVFGNHEKNKSEEFLVSYIDMLNSKNVKILDDSIYELNLENKKLNIIGMTDTRDELVQFVEENIQDLNISIADFVNKNNDSEKAHRDIIKNKLDKIFKENEAALKDGYNILLSHRPEGFSIYKDYDIDLALTGHAHGGLRKNSTY